MPDWVKQHNILEIEMEVIKISPNNSVINQITYYLQHC